MSEHIEVKLDFIPVAERLPVGRPSAEEQYPVLRTSPGIPRLELLVFWWDGKEWTCDEGMPAGNENYRITHWAEIPEIEVSDD